MAQLIEEKLNTNEPASPPAEGTRSVAVVSVLSATGMLLGYARDAGLVIFFGTALASDAFFAATLIPIMLGRVIMSGALAPAVVPVFAGLLERKRDPWAVLNAILTIFALVLVGLSAVLSLGAPLFIQWLAPGFETGRAEQAVRLLIITAPAVFLMGISALLGAMLNVLGLYAVPAMGTVLVNGLSLLALPIGASTLGVEGVALGMVAGSLAQLILQWVSLRRKGWLYRPSLNFRSAEVRRVIQLFLPLLAFMLVDQCVTVTERVIASGFAPGELSHLTLAGKLYQIPSLTLSGAVAVVMFPLLARGRAGGNLARYSEILKGAFRNVVFLTAPAALWLFFGSNLIVRLFFQHGEVTPADAHATAELVRLYSLAVVPTGLLLVVNRAFHASSIMYLPLIMGLGFAAFYVVIALLLSHSLGIAGLPLAFTISQCVSLLVAFGFLVSRNFSLRTLRDGKLAITLAVNGVLAIGLFGWSSLLEPVLTGQSPFIQLLGLIVGLGLSGLFYLWLAKRWAIPEAAAYLRMFQKRFL